MSRLIRIATPAIIAVTCCLVMGCSKPKFIILDPEFAQAGIQQVFLLPVVDRRPDKSLEIDIDKEVGERCKKALEDRGYAVQAATSFSGADATITAQRVAIMTDDELYTLGPDNDAAIIVVFLDDSLKKKSLFKFQSKMELTGILLDRGQKKILWKARGIGENSEGGILGALLESAMFSSDATKYAVSNLFASLPKVEKK